MTCLTAAAQACVDAFAPVAASLDAGALCPGVKIYEECVSNWAVACGVANAAMAAPFVNAVNAAVATSQAICVSITTTVTAWDSSASSGSEQSLVSSNSYNSFSSGSSGSLHSSASNPSNSYASIGSNASGSFGSFLQLWQWLLVAASLCICVASILGLMMNKKPKKTKKKAAPQPAPAPAAPVVEMAVEPLLPQLMPLATSSGLIPSYSMMNTAPYSPSYAPVQQYAAPAMAAPAFEFPMTGLPHMTQQYAAPVTTSYAAAAPAMYAAQPATQFAGFAGTTSYATGATMGAYPSTAGAVV